MNIAVRCKTQVLPDALTVKKSEFLYCHNILRTVCTCRLVFLNRPPEPCVSVGGTDQQCTFLHVERTGERQVSSDSPCTRTAFFHGHLAQTIGNVAHDIVVHARSIKNKNMISCTCALHSAQPHPPAVGAYGSASVDRNPPLRRTGGRHGTHISARIFENRLASSISRTQRKCADSSADEGIDRRAYGTHRTRLSKRVETEDSVLYRYRSAERTHGRIVCTVGKMPCSGALLRDGEIVDVPAGFPD